MLHTSDISLTLNWLTLNCEEVWGFYCVGQEENEPPNDRRIEGHLPPGTFRVVESDLTDMVKLIKPKTTGGVVYYAPLEDVCNLLPKAA